MQGIEHNIETTQLLRGTERLAEKSWLPRRLDIGAMRERLLAGRVMPADDDAGRSAYVERLALAFNAMSLRKRRDAVEEWSELELLGNEVSPAFAEMGCYACDVLEAIIALSNGEAIRKMWLETVYFELGQLWSSAFGAPEGYAHFIGKSIGGLLPQERSFLIVPPKQEGLSPAEEGRYLGAVVDLLQTGIATRNLPDSTVGVEPTMPEWRNPVGKGGSIPGIERNILLDTHVMRESLPHGERIEVVLRDASNGEAIAGVQGVVLQGSTGMYDEFSDLTEGAGRIVTSTVRGLFAHENVVGLYPRVRDLLDMCGNKLHRIGIIEGMVVKRRHRGGNLGKRVLGQFLVEAGRLDGLFAKPEPIQPSFAVTRATRGVQAGLAVGTLRLARRLASVGGKMMLDGIMGIDAIDLSQLSDDGLRIREGG